MVWPLKEWVIYLHLLQHYFAKNYNVTYQSDTFDPVTGIENRTIYQAGDFPSLKKLVLGNKLQPLFEDQIQHFTLTVESSKKEKEYFYAAWKSEPPKIRMSEQDLIRNFAGHDEFSTFNFSQSKKLEFFKILEKLLSRRITYVVKKHILQEFFERKKKK